MQSTQGHKSHSLNLGVVDPAVVRAALTLELLAPQSHSDPLVEFPELRHARRERSPEVALHARFTEFSFAITCASRLWLRVVSSLTLAW